MRAAIFFATREGHTRKIADRLAADLRARGVDTAVFDVRDTGCVDWPAYSCACLAASVHAGRHEPEMIAFARRHRAELERVSAAFISVTLSEAGAEDPQRWAAARPLAAGPAPHII
jgi:menaquinone-dependent protoporphyrinogen oxidase